MPLLALRRTCVGDSVHWLNDSGNLFYDIPSDSHRAGSTGGGVQRALINRGKAFNALRSYLDNFCQAVNNITGSIGEDVGWPIVRCLVLEHRWSVL